jgi:hypothetical protein
MRLEAVRAILHLARKEVVIVPTTTFTRGRHDMRPHERRVHRLRVNLVAWGAGTVAVTGLWMLHEWQANGAFERFAHEDNPGDWNPTLWAVVVGLWSLVVGIMALGVHFDRPDGRFRFHVAAWGLGMLVLTPINLLIEWQDNGAFERWSSNSRPGSWDPWVVRVGAVWALGIAALALWERAAKRKGA